MRMRIERTEERGVIIIAIFGVLKLGESARRLADDLDRALEEGAQAVILDLEGIDSVDSTGLGELVGYLQRFGEQGRRLVLLRPGKRILNLLKLTRLDEIFPIYESREDALAELA